MYNKASKGDNKKAENKHETGEEPEIPENDQGNVKRVLNKHKAGEESEIP